MWSQTIADTSVVSRYIVSSVKIYGVQWEKWEKWDKWRKGIRKQQERQKVEATIRATKLKGKVKNSKILQTRESLKVESKEFFIDHSRLETLYGE